MSVVKIKGVSITLGGTDYIVPPLNLNAMVQFEEQIKTLTGTPDLQTLRLVVDLAHAALKRNYPDIDREFLGENIDFGNFIDVLDAVMGATGLVKQAAREATIQAADNQ